MDKECSTHITDENSYTILCHKPRPSRRKENSIETCQETTDCVDVNCINVIQDTEQWWAVVTAVMKLVVSKKREDFTEQMNG